MRILELLWVQPPMHLQQGSLLALPVYLQQGSLLAPCSVAGGEKEGGRVLGLKDSCIDCLC